MNFFEYSIHAKEVYGPQYLELFNGYNEDYNIEFRRPKTGEKYVYQGVPVTAYSDETMYPNPSYVLVSKKFRPNFPPLTVTVESVYGDKLPAILKDLETREDREKFVFGFVPRRKNVLAYYASTVFDPKLLGSEFYTIPCTRIYKKD